MTVNEILNEKNWKKNTLRKTIPGQKKHLECIASEIHTSISNMNDSLVDSRFHVMTRVKNGYKTHDYVLRITIKHYVSKKKHKRKSNKRK